MRACHLRLDICVRTLVLLSATVVLCAQQQDPAGWNNNPQATPPSLQQDRNGVLTLRTGVQLVLQDITVTDAAGRPVSGLTQKDFHIFEDGHEQIIKNFEEHAPVDPALARERADELAHVLPPNTFTNDKAFSGGTLVVFLLDTIESIDCGSGAEAQMHLRQEMLDYMKTVPLGTPFIILQLDSGLHMLQDMTTDLNEITNAIHAKSNFPKLPPALSSDAPEFLALAPYAPNLRRRQIVSAAMKGLEQYLGAMPGRKSLVWLAGEIEPSLILINPGVGELKSYPTIRQYLTTITTSLQQNRVALYRIEATPIHGSGSLNIADDHPPTFNIRTGESTPEPVSMYKDGNGSPVNPPGWSSQYVAEAAMYQTPVACSYPEGKERIAAIVDRSQHYYTLTYSPTNQNWNGRPRVFSVQLADPALHLDYRKSYAGGLGDTTVQRVSPVETAASASVLHEAAGASISMQTAMGMGTVEPTQVIFEASATRAATETKDSGNPPGTGNFLLAKYRKQGYRDYTVHFRVRADELKLVPSPDASYSGKLEFVAVVYDAQGQAVNGKREKASASFANLTDPELQTASVTGDLTIQVPAKGSYFLRLGVHDTATDRVGALEIPVDRIGISGTAH